ncbi:MAG: DDE-type integrase/transposase/recombinase [Elusimicrobiota bacterium]
MRRLCEEAASKIYEREDGRQVRVKARTIEAWYYRYRTGGGLRALRPEGRSDAGVSRAIRPELAERVLALKREKMRRSVRMIIRTLERAGEARRGELRRSTVHRLLQAHGISSRPSRPEGERERRAFRPEHAGALWMGDVMHGPQVLADGRRRKAYLHLFIDAATRYVVGAAFRLGETALDHQVVLKGAIRVHGRPLVLYLDQGAAQKARSLRLSCAELEIRLLHCRPYDPESKAGVERFFRTFRAEVLDELPPEPLTLEELNSRMWSWLSVEYHAREHGGTKRRPREHWVEQAEQLRPAPRKELLDAAFQHRIHRKVRKDGTVRFGGRLVEVRPDLCGTEVELRYDPEHPEGLPRVYKDDAFVCDTVALDLVRNSQRRRRPARPATESAPRPTGLDPLSLMQDEHARKTRNPNEE